MALNDKIRELRKAQNWSQEEMAEKMEMSKNGYARIERGEGKLDWDKLQKIAAIFKIDIVQLIEAENKGFVIQQTIGFHNDDNNHHYGNNIDSLVIEIEKLKLTVAYQKELLEQKNNEIQTLNTIVAVLKEASHK